jgi:hypothetical protein
MKKTITLCLAACALASNNALGMLPEQTTSNQNEKIVSQDNQSHKTENQELQEIKNMIKENREILEMTFVQNILHYKIDYYKHESRSHPNNDKIQDYCLEQHISYNNQLKNLQKHYYKLINKSSSTYSSKNSSLSTYSSEKSSSSASSNED